MAEKMAEGLFESRASLVRINMSEFSEKFGSTKLIGSPPGYIGYGDSNQLTDKVMRKPYCLVLLDGIEHADESVIKLFMAAISKGSMTDSSGKEVNFKNSVIVMTMTVDPSDKSGKLGFSDHHDSDNDSDNQTLRDDLIEVCRRTFGSDFVNHIDEFVPFVDISKEDLKRIVKCRLDQLVSKLLDLDFRMSYSDDVVNMVVEGSIIDEKPSAKTVDRYVRRSVEPIISELLSDRNKTDGKFCLVVDDGNILCIGSSVVAETIN